jgi:hypothetical protein
MRQDAVCDYLARAEANWAVVQRLIDKGELVETEHGRHKFYVRRLRMNSGGI